MTWSGPTGPDQGPRATPGAWLAVAAAVGLQIAYPLTSGGQRATVTVLAVVAFFLASVSHAAAARGPRWAVTTATLAAGLGLLAESVGVRTGWPFGEYAYGTALGPDVAGVPAVVPLAWAMMGLPALLLGQRCARSLGPRRRPVTRRAVTALVGGATLTAWDLFLDPQMVAEGYWTWAGGGPALNGIPLTNAAGWLLVGTVLTGVLAAVTPTGEVADDRVPAVLLGWTYVSSVLANLVFFGRPGVAFAGGVAMGAVLGLAVVLDRRHAVAGSWDVARSQA